MNEVQKISQNWPTCHKIEMVYNELLNGFYGVMRAKEHFRNILVLKGFIFNHALF